jgi:hypothetical protein
MQEWQDAYYIENGGDDYDSVITTNIIAYQDGGLYDIDRLKIYLNDELVADINKTIIAEELYELLIFYPFDENTTLKVEFKYEAFWTTYTKSCSVDLVNSDFVFANGIAVEMESASISGSTVCRFESAETYESGSLTVKIDPDGASQAGAEWTINGGTNWMKSNQTLSDIDEGDYLLQFKRVRGWRKPKDQTITIVAGEETTVNGNYRLAQGSATLLVDVKPSQAKTEGAMFKLEDGEWQSPTGMPIMVDSGDYLLTFKDTTNWVAPKNIDLGLDENATELITGQYLLYGDADGNEIVDIKDMIRLQQTLVGLSSDSLPEKPDVLDLSSDGVLGIADVIIFFQKIAESSK